MTKPKSLSAGKILPDVSPLVIIDEANDIPEPFFNFLAAQAEQKKAGLPNVPPYYIPLPKKRRYNPIGYIRSWFYGRRVRREIERAVDFSEYLTKTTYKEKRLPKP